MWGFKVKLVCMDEIFGTLVKVSKTRVLYGSFMSYEVRVMKFFHENKESKESKKLSLPSVFWKGECGF